MKLGTVLYKKRSRDAEEILAGAKRDGFWEQLDAIDAHSVPVKYLIIPQMLSIIANSK